VAKLQVPQIELQTQPSNQLQLLALQWLLSSTL
jgi:hypothetical protein